MGRRVSHNEILRQNIERHKTEAYFYDATHITNASIFEWIRVRRQIRKLVAELDLNQPVLDLGSGTGYLVKHLRHFGVEAIVCDISPDMLNENPANVRILCDATHLPFQDGYFGAIVGYSVFHHFPDPEAVMREVVRVSGKRCILHFGHDPFCHNAVMRRNDFSIFDVVGWLVFLLIHPNQIGRLVQYAFGGRHRHLTNIAPLGDCESFGRVRVVELTRILKDADFSVEIMQYDRLKQTACLKAYRGL